MRQYGKMTASKLSYIVLAVFAALFDLVPFNYALSSYLIKVIFMASDE